MLSNIFLCGLGGGGVPWKLYCRNHVYTATILSLEPSNKFYSTKRKSPMLQKHTKNHTNPPPPPTKTYINSTKINHWCFNIKVNSHTNPPSTPTLPPPPSQKRRKNLIMKKISSVPQFGHCDWGLCTYAPVSLCRIDWRMRTNWPFKFVWVIIPGHSGNDNDNPFEQCSSHAYSFGRLVWKFWTCSKFCVPSTNNFHSCLCAFKTCS